MKVKLFLFSFLCFSAVIPAYADIASKEYVDERIPGVMTGAGEALNGQAGLVPQPKVGDEDAFLRGDGTWTTPVVPNNATLTIKNTGNDAGTWSSDSAEAKTIDINVSQVRSGSATSTTLVNMWLE